jgi:hypothetical protein
MNPEVKAKWLKALRSGEYKQGRQRLRKDNRFCCLGVLCDIYIKDTQRGKWENDTFIDVDGARERGILTNGVVEWSGLENGNPTLTVYSEALKDLDSLTEMNDRGMSFNEIANFIEQNL